MAVLLPSMSAITHIQSHMTDAHGRQMSSDLPDAAAKLSTAGGSKRPKLSLQTTSLSNTYGSLTRGIGAPQNSEATFTPTTTNTLVNQWELSIRPSPVTRTESPVPSSLRNQPNQHPYNLSLPFGVRPILKNSPLPSRQASVSASPRDSRRKVFFPQPKQVAFRKNLEEVIETTRFTARHSDLSSSEEDRSEDDVNAEPGSPLVTSIGAGLDCSPPPKRKRKCRRDTGISIDTSVQSKISVESTIPKSTRSCKRRKWQWTTGVEDLATNPSPSLASPASSGSADEDPAGEVNAESAKDDQRAIPEEHPQETCSGEPSGTLNGGQSGGDFSASFTMTKETVLSSELVRQPES